MQLFVEHLEVSNFRVIENLSFEPNSSGVTSIVGRNGHGKSSIIEALSFAISGKSFRSAPKESLIRRGSNESLIRVQVITNEERALSLDSLITRSGQDKLRLNTNAVSRREVFRTIPLTAFSVTDIEIVSSSPQLRRDYMDSALVLLGVKAAESVDNYEKLLRHRTSLLKSIQRSGDFDSFDYLEVFDERLAEEGERVVTFRMNFLARIESRLEEMYQEIAGTGHSVRLGYSRSSDDLYRDLKVCRSDDIRKGSTGVGPHRDDLLLYLNGLNARYEASQGEQRTLAFALKMALHRLILDRSGDSPILLLDDIFSELDEVRIESLLDGFDSTQCIVTTSIDHKLLASVGPVFHIENGSIH
ncbi:MAG: DNA replication and repair protein RecF [Actinomycetota bacterium]|nr:DNA replication and repair protein RecF [Actinomycetota bacterium]